LGKYTSAGGGGGGSGDITAVSFVTDSGSGSKASDDSDSADFSILGGAGVDVTNSGTTITVAGETASDSNAGIVELATTAEAIAGTDTARAITAEGLLAKVNEIVVNSSASTTTLTASQSGAVVFLNHANAACTLPNGCAVGTHFTIINNTGASETIGLNTNGVTVTGMANNVISDHMSKTFICVNLAGSVSSWAVIG
tara:strand:- start:79704 stop:80297 length:594 start_codon:yes stop_codon:yes gene_type:complete